jgi:hypothetical protein
MRKIPPLIIGVVLGITVLPIGSYGQTWLDFAHPSTPHIDMTGPDVPISTVGLVQGNGDVTVTRPTLVILMEWSDMTHRSEHTVAFWRDLVFGNNRTPRPSVADIIRENSNGRFVLVPATAGDTHDGNADGVVGWVATSQSSATLIDPSQKRAEAIRVADPLFDFSVYDTNGDGDITTDELLIITIFADNAAVSACCFQTPVPDDCVCPSCDQHHADFNHPQPNGCVWRPGGNTRQTDPRYVFVDEVIPEWECFILPSLCKYVYQYVAGLGEMAHEGVVAHEIGHSTLGLGDLYPIDPKACSTYTQVQDGYLCTADWYPPSPDDFSMMASYFFDFTPHIDPWGKIHHGFVKPLVITHDGTYTLYAAETERTFSQQGTQAEAAIIFDPLRTNPYRQYFIIENRNQPLLVDQGLALWLINEEGPNWPSGLNSRKEIRLVRREGHWGNLNQALWDGVNDTDGYDITAISTPRNTNWTDGTPSYIEIDDISQSGSSMTVRVVIPPIFVDSSNTGVENGTQSNPFNTIQEAVNAIPDPPRTIRVSGGSYPGPLVIDKACTLKGWRNGNAVIGQ